MTLSIYEPPPLEIKITLGLGLTILSPYYHSFAQSLNLHGDERVLDFGSGSGVCSRHIAACIQRGGHLDCADISHGWMNIARKTLRRYKNVSYHLGHIAQLDLPDSTFDVIVVHFVLHDIPEGERPGVVKALGRRLKPGGRLIAREPQGRGLTLEELNQLTAAAGLHPINIRPNKVWIGNVYDGAFAR